MKHNTLGILPAALLLVVSLASCATQYGRLEPANPAARQIGDLRLSVSEPTAAGSYPVEIVLPSGERLRGNARETGIDETAFGQVLAAVYGSGATNLRMRSRGRLGVIALSSRGASTMTCEYVGAMRGSLTGACRHSTGALFRLHK